jgi:hypothetical protein
VAIIMGKASLSEWANFRSVKYIVKYIIESERRKRIERVEAYNILHCMY